MKPEAGASPAPALIPEIDDRDAAGFLKGFNLGLFSIERGIRLRTAMAPPRADGRPRVFYLFENVGRSGRWQLRQEVIPHWAAVVELVDEYGWGRDLVRSDNPRVHDLPVGAVDLVVFEHGIDRRAVIVGEAKDKAAHLQRLIDHMASCPGYLVPSHGQSEHWKCRAVAALQPRYFLGVAAGTRRAFEVHQLEGPAPRLDEVDVSVLRRT